MVGETVLTKFFTGSPMQVEFLLKNLTHRSFNADGSLKENWWNTDGEKLTIHMRLSEGFGITLYGTFAHPMTVDPTILSIDVNSAMGSVAR
jgi:hypothetical protein